MSEGDPGGQRAEHGAKGPSGEITAVLRRLEDGDPEAPDQLMDLAYAEIRRIAAGYHQRERAGHTLQPTEVVHEAFLRLFGGAPPRMSDRHHFFASFARAVRHVHVDHARARAALKRGGDAERTTLSGLQGVAGSDAQVDLISLHDALERLASLSERQARIVDLRFFAGLSIDEIADLLGLSRTTVNKEWAVARAWLAAELTA